MTTTTTPTFERPYRHPAVRLFNGTGRLLRTLGLRRFLCADSILRSASRQTGLTDWGTDEMFHEGLERLVRSLEVDCRLTPLGRFLHRRACILHAKTRLLLQYWLKKEPLILQEQIQRPLFVVGFPRTGTTLLHNVLCQDRRGRPLLLYEALEPVIPPDYLPGLKDPRLDRARAWVYLTLRYTTPQMSTVHPLDAESPEECTFLLLNTFRTLAYLLLGSVTSYLDWLRERGDRDIHSVYEDYRRQLQFLQWRRPGRYWILKSPLHLRGLGALLQLFPDARVVQTHRPMAKVLASACSLTAVSRGTYSDHVDCKALRNDALNFYQDFYEPMIKARAAYPGRVFDLHYADLVRDPVAAVRSIYEYFAMTPEQGMEQRVRQWVARNAADKHGVHRYDLAQFGLTEADVENSFGAYHEQFGIKSETARS